MKPLSASTFEHDAWLQLEARLLEFDRPYTPGIHVIVLQGSHTVFSRGYGRASPAFDIPWTADTKYRVASVTKPFVGQLMLLLAAEGYLSFDDPIRRFLPELPGWADAIRIRHLLTMTSGIPHIEATLAALAGTERATLDELFELTGRVGLHFEPGTAALYSCENYRLAARIAERATGESFEALLHSKIFEPLGMHDTSSHPDYDLDLPRLAVLHHPTENGLRREQTRIQMSGDGAVISTANDLACWLAYLRDPKRGRELLRRMGEPARLHDGRTTTYGFGLGSTFYRSHPALEHSGSFGSYIFHLPEVDVSVVLLCNRLDIDRWVLARQLLDALFYNTVGTEGEWLNYPAYISDREVFEHHTGEYVNPETGYHLTLSLHDGALHVQFLGRSERLAPVSRTQFYSVTLASTLTLKIDSERIHATLPQHNQRTFIRVIPHQLCVHADYVGTYYNRALELRHEIIECDSHLVLVSREGFVTTVRRDLEPLAPDVFVAGSIGLRFERDARGRVTSVTESINLARDLHFARLEAMQAHP
jgi:CubicO group peptidase (beta-lactamase class C family)